ncbi:uncharacterized protein B0H64DRAFT_457449 [Chaetomium fimeti]|uniref:Uncharacterized protein n=1 Tax=Chaetomium fimeti TaxID=1854472 RepID=A0AAE0HIX6_9PEZI|nr:hypothetical protein B0H64DRAFT_457449 [Chaetomium fimeti]
MNTFRKNGRSAVAPVQRPGRKRPQSTAQHSQTATTKTTKKVVPGPGGKPVQVVQTEQHVVKKTVWTRAMSGASKAAKPGTWKHSGKSVKKIIPHASKQGKDSEGFNMSYYRPCFFALKKQEQFDLYVNGLAPRMTMLEVAKLKASRLHATRAFDVRAVMYSTHKPPKGYAIPQRNLVAEAELAKQRCLEEAAARRHQKHAATATAADGDALPAHPTPDDIAEIRLQARLARARLEKEKEENERERQRQRERQRELQEARQLQRERVERVNDLRQELVRLRERKEHEVVKRKRGKKAPTRKDRDVWDQLQEEEQKLEQEYLRLRVQVQQHPVWERQERLKDVKHEHGRLRERMACELQRRKQAKKAATRKDREVWAGFQEEEKGLKKEHQKLRLELQQHREELQRRRDQYVEWKERRREALERKKADRVRQTAVAAAEEHGRGKGRRMAGRTVASSSRN